MTNDKPAAAGDADVRVLERIGSAAAAHVAARERVRDLTAARNRIECARVAPERDEGIVEGDYRTAGYPEPPDGGWQSQPCWKPIFERVGYENGCAVIRDGWSAVGGEPSDWCDACRRRQGLHSELQRAKKTIGGTYLALRLAVRARVTP